MSPRIAEAFSSGTLIRPRPREPDSVHLVRALATLTGSKGLDEMPATRQMMEVIGPADHYVFILLDGLGMNLIRGLPQSSFLQKHLRGEFLAVCPSTTACALTSIATGHWPAQHGVTGWFTHLPEHGLSMTTLPFTDRFTNQRLTERGLSVDQVLPLPCWQKQMTYEPTTLLPLGISNTVYANYSRGYTPAVGYQTIPEAIDWIIHRLSEPRGKSYTHLYIPDVDTRCHHVGTGHPTVVDLVTQIEAQLQRLAEAVDGRARIVISADHGLIDVPVSHHMSLFADDPLLELLKAPPSGDARLPVFHVKEGRDREFVEGFAQHYGHSMELLPVDEAVEINLFGAGEMSETSRRRFGDYVGIALRNATLHYVPQRVAEVDKPREPYLAQHAGLSPAEMEIPLVIA